MFDPIELFNRLDKSRSSISKLRKAQDELLAKYAKELQNVPRIGIKLPTGSGKSLIAILILEAWRLAGKVVAIVTANKGLAEDMKKRCDELGIPSATIFGASGETSYLIERTRNLRRYKLKQLIGIFNYHAFLYGTEYKQEIFPPDVLVIDDASDFETVRNEFFTVRINRENHPKIYNAVIKALSSYSHLYPNLREFEGKRISQSGVELVYFTHTADVLAVLREHMPELRKDTDFNFSFERNRTMLSSFLIFITNYEIELRSLLVPEKLLKMGNIGQVIFMSATLPDEELLHKIFGIGKSQIHIIDEQSISREAFEEIETMGKRLIFPLDQTDLGTGVSPKCLDILLTLTRIHKKTLVLANSHYDTDRIRRFLESKQIPVLVYKTADDSEYFTHKMERGVLLCANRYLGLDFPGKTCQVEVIVRLPAIWDSVDAFQSTILNNNFYVEQRVGNRLTQSFGRCNRLETDESLYYILDSRILARLIGEEQYLRYLPRNMYAELMTGYALSQGGDIGQAIKYGEESFFGAKDSNYYKILEEEKKAWSHQKINQFISKYDLEIEAWEKALAGSYESSGQLFDFVADQCRQNAENFPNQNLEMMSAFNFYLSAMCYFNAFHHYNNPRDKQLCLEALKKAIDYGGNSSWFNHLRAVYNSLVEKESEKLPFELERIEIRQVKENIAPRYEDFINRNSSKQKNWKDVLNQLIGDASSGSHGQMVVALQKFFELLGFETALGDNAKGEPDLIAFSPLTSWKYQLSIEAKTKEKGEEEPVASVTQSIGDCGVVERKTSCRTFALLITQKEVFSGKAEEVAKGKAKLFTSSAFAVLMNKVLKAIDEWSNLSSSGKPAFIDSIISPYELHELFKPSDDPIVKTEDVRNIRVKE